MSRYLHFVSLDVLTFNIPPVFVYNEFKSNESDFLNKNSIARKVLGITS